jgi:hypothetical protein
MLRLTSLEAQLKSAIVSAFLFVICGAASAAATPPAVRLEIDALLGKLQTSGCQFNRNGSWYTGQEAKLHLLRKLEYFEGKGTIQSAEQYIDLAAAKSSSSGKAYQVQCAGQSAVASKVWLTQQLAAIRAAGSK